MIHIVIYMHSIQLNSRPHSKGWWNFATVDQLSIWGTTRNRRQETTAYNSCMGFTQLMLCMWMWTMHVVMDSPLLVGAWAIFYCNMCSLTSNMFAQSEWPWPFCSCSSITGRELWLSVYRHASPVELLFKLKLLCVLARKVVCCFDAFSTSCRELSEVVLGVAACIQLWIIFLGQVTVEYILMWEC